jgi:holo-[acyl-carrier protein] synthase
LREPAAAGALLGVEVGLIETPRFRRALERHGDRLLERVFTRDEIDYARRKKSSEHNLAARFAAKCAGRRALLRLSGRRVKLVQLEVVRRRSGEPTLVARDEAAELLPGSACRFSLSLTHDADFAMASLWLEEGP